MKSLLKTRLVEPIRRLLTQGLSPRMLALSLAVGMVVGIFPVVRRQRFARSQRLCCGSTWSRYRLHF
jgi:hypothetical protein